MKSYERFTDPELLQLFVTLLTKDRVTTAGLIGVMAEIDDRKLYLPARYDSMHAFSVGAYGMSEDEADNRIRAARTARKYPAILASLADGRLHLTAVLLVSRRLTPENAEELLAEAAHKSKREILDCLERRFPSTAVLPWVEDLGAEPTVPSVPERIEPVSVPERITPAEPTGRTAPRARVSVSGAVQFNLSPRGQDRLRHVQDLLGHQGFAHDLREIFERSLDAYIAHLEKRKFGATSRPRGSRRGSTNPRYIPAEVRQAVWRRDEGQCTYASEYGHRCAARSMLEFDHIVEVARGGEATVDNLRLRCRAHNQYTAEHTFGAEFMRQKRESARERAQERRAAATAVVDPKPKREWDPDRDVEPWLHALGVRGDDLARGAAAAATIPDAALEERVRFALRTLARGRAPRGARQGAPGITEAA